MLTSLSNKARIGLVTVVVLLVAGNIYFGSRTVVLKKQLTAAASQQELNTKVINFTNLFIAKVLQVKEPVDFETRLQLENNIRDIKDADLLAQWNKFVGSANETDAQTETKNLLQLLVQKIKVK